MALQASGAISLANIQTEFGGADPISMSEYYRNGGLVTSNNTNVPTSGQISVSQFYGALKDVIGQVEYTTAGTFSWVCPAGVTSVCVVAIGPGGKGGYANGAGSGGGGGGGLGWKNNIPVVPGNSYTVVVGAPTAGVNGAGTNSYFIDTTTVRGNAGGTGGGGLGGGGGAGGYVGDGGGNGGTGGAVDYVSGRYGGGGGAGGYSGAGGEGGDNAAVATAGAGGGGGGGTGGSVGSPAGGGGGVGRFGQGSNGAAPSGAGSSGSNGGGQGVGTGGNYGGGGAGYDSTVISAPTPGGGAVRIIWGSGRAFPSTNTGNL